MLSRASIMSLSIQSFCLSSSSSGASVSPHPCLELLSLIIHNAHPSLIILIWSFRLSLSLSGASVSHHPELLSPRASSSSLLVQSFHHPDFCPLHNIIWSFHPLCNIVWSFHLSEILSGASVSLHPELLSHQEVSVSP